MSSRDGSVCTIITGMVEVAAIWISRDVLSFRMVKESSTVRLGRSGTTDLSSFWVVAGISCSTIIWLVGDGNSRTLSYSFQNRVAWDVALLLHSWCCLVKEDDNDDDTTGRFLLNPRSYFCLLVADIRIDGDASTRESIGGEILNWWSEGYTTVKAAAFETCKLMMYPCVVSRLALARAREKRIDAISRVWLLEVEVSLRWDKVLNAT